MNAWDPEVRAVLRVHAQRRVEAKRALTRHEDACSGVSGCVYCTLLRRNRNEADRLNAFELVLLEVEDLS